MDSSHQVVLLRLFIGRYRCGCGCGSGGGVLVVGDLGITVMRVRRRYISAICLFSVK